MFTRREINRFDQFVELHDFVYEFVKEFYENEQKIIDGTYAFHTEKYHPRIWVNFKGLTISSLSTSKMSPSYNRLNQNLSRIEIVLRKRKDVWKISSIIFYSSTTNFIYVDLVYPNDRKNCIVKDKNEGVEFCTKLDGDKLFSEEDRVYHSLSHPGSRTIKT